MKRLHTITNRRLLGSGDWKDYIPDKLIKWIDKLFKPAALKPHFDTLPKYKPPVLKNYGLNTRGVV